MATEAIQSEYQILFNDALRSVNTFINTLDSKLASVGSSTKSNISSKIESGFDGLGGRLGRIFDTAFGTVLGGAIQNGIGQINNLLTSGFEATINFDAQISSIKALTGATGAELEKIKNASLQAGKDTKFSALEAAQGFEELLKAGIPLDAIFSGGLTGALDLAVAGGIAVRDAAEIASTGLNTFAKDGLVVAEVGNILAGAANVSATNVSELKFALSSVGVVAAQSGQSLIGTSTALALFAQNGLKGSDAGTSLKTFLNNLIPTTKKASETLMDLGIVTADGTNKFINANGSFKGLKDITQILNDSTKNLTESQKSLALETIFGSDAIRAAGILSKTTGTEFDRLSENILKIKAADVAKEKLNNLKGAFETLKGSIETNQILLLGGLQPALTQLTKGFDGFINSIDFSKVGESLSSFVSTAIKESTNLFNLLFKGDFTGLFGLGKDSKVVDFLFNIRDAFLNTVSFIQNNPFKFSFPDFTPLLESISGFGSSVIKLFESIGKNEFFKTVTSALDDLSKALIQVGLPFIIDRVTDLFNLLASNQTVLEIVLGVVTALAVAFGAFALIAPIIGIISSLGFVFTSLGIIFGLLTTPIGLIVLAIAVFILLATAVVENWGTISKFFTELWDGVKNTFNQAWESLKATVNNLWESVKARFNEGKLALENTLNDLGQSITNQWNQIKNSVTDAWNNTINSVKDNAQNLVNAVTNTFGSIKDGVVNALTGLPDKVGKIFNDLKDGAVNTFNNLIDTIKNLLSNIKLPELKFPEIKLPSIPSFASGTNFFEGGLARFGERGRELLQFPNGLQSLVNQDTTGFLPRGTRILNNQDTNRYLRANSTVNIPQLPNPKPDLSTVSNRNVSNVNTNNQSSQNNSNNNYTNYGNNYQMSAVNKYSF